MSKSVRRSLVALCFIVLTASYSWAQVVVTTLADSGPGSLRAAITTANGDAAATAITFDAAIFPPPPAAPGVILLSTALPNLNGAGDSIDGTGAGVVIDGTGLPAGTVGLRVRRSNVTIRGLTITEFRKI